MIEKGGEELCTTTVRPDGTWSCTPEKDLGDGEHTLVVTETDPAGNESKPVERPFVVDTDTATPVIKRPGEGALIGDKRPTFDGTAEPGATVTVKEGDKTLCTATADKNGHWSCKSTVELADGSHKVTATAKDEAGNVSDPSADRTFTIDSTKPATPGITAPTPGEQTNDPTPEVTGTGEPGATVEVKDGEDGPVVCTATVRPDGTWSCTPKEELGEGEHTLVVTETDDAGNKSGPSDVTFTVDTTAPDAPVIKHPGEGAFVNTPKPTIDGTAEPGSKVTVKEGDKTICTATADKDGKWSCKPTAPLSDGEHKITVTAIDEAGNVSKPSERPFVVDTTPPAPPIVDETDGSIIVGKTITGSGDEEGLLVNITDKNGKVIPGCEGVRVDANNRFMCRPTVPLKPGDEVYVSFTDKAGNTSERVMVTVTSHGGATNVEPEEERSLPAVGTGGSVLSGAPLAWLGVLLVTSAVAVMAFVARRRDAVRN